jgi:SulP family sulfate permease
MANQSSFITSVSAGLIAGIRTILGSAAMVTLILPGSLAFGIPEGLDALLIGGAVLGAIVAWMSSYPGVVAQVQDGPAVIIGVMAASIIATMENNAPPELVLLVVLACASVAAFSTGIIFYGLGVYRLGGLVRFIPYPVIGGFLAGSGYLILRGAFPVLTGLDLHQATMVDLTEPMHLARWVPGVAFGVTMLLVLRRFNHFLIVPGMLLGAFVLFHGIISLSNMPMNVAQMSGWLLGPFPEGGSLHLPGWIRLPPEGWVLLAAHIPTFGAIILVSVVALLLNASGLEMATRSELNINHELRATGVANMVAGVFGGPVGFHALSASLLGYRMGANSRLIGITSAALCGLALFFGTALLAYFPKAILGGLLLSMGAGLLIEWLYDGWKKLPKQDYMIVLLIVVVIGALGILAGVVVGIVVAMMIFVISYSRVRVIRQELSGAEYHSHVERSPVALNILKEKGQVIHIIRLEGFIFFGTAYTVQSHIQALMRGSAEAPLRYLLLDFEEVRASDTSAISVFAKIHAFCERRDCALIFTRMNAEVEKQFRHAALGEAKMLMNIYPDLDLALEYCEEQLLAAEGETQVMSEASIWDRIAAVLPAGTPISDFIAYLEPRDYAPGDYLMRQGGPPDELFFIESGRITIRLLLDDGRSLRLRAMTTGTTVGEIGLYLNQPRTASAVADQPTRAYILTVAKLREMEKNDPPLANALHYAIVALLSERLSGTNGLLQRLIS